MKPSEASSLIRHLDDLDAKSLLTIVYMRVSTKEQRRRCNLKNRYRTLVRDLRQRGVQRCGYFTEVRSGSSLRKRPALRQALEAARQLQAQNPDAVVAIVSDTRNRFVRGALYNGRASTDEPSPGQWARLRRMAHGVTLATMLPPNATFSKVREHEVHIATRAGKRVGRPPKPPVVHKKGRREELLTEIRGIHDLGETSLRQLARRYDVPKSTICRWLKP